MKKIKHSFLRSSNWLLAGILGIFGFTNTSCKMEYGTPERDYVIKGKVMDSETKKPVKGIKVETYRCYGAIDTTDIQGSFLLKIWEEGSVDKIGTKFSDIDGIENGLYPSDTIIDIDMKDAKRTKPKSGNWYQGEFTKTVEIELPKILENE